MTHDIAVKAILMEKMREARKAQFARAAASIRLRRAWRSEATANMSGFKAAGAGLAILRNRLFRLSLKGHDPPRRSSSRTRDLNLNSEQSDVPIYSR